MENVPIDTAKEIGAYQEKMVSEQFLLKKLIKQTVININVTYDLLTSLLMCLVDNSCR